MRVLVTGAKGMLGTDVCSACALRGHEVIALSRSQLDITDGRAADELLAEYEPGVVINCAAWSDVDGAEDHEREASRVNDEGAAVLAASAAAIDAAYLYPSSDYVFDGKKREPYVESDHPAPLSAYGRSKYGGETSVAVANPKHWIVRSSWIFGIAGRNFVETMLNLASEQSEVLVVSDQLGCPTYARHLAAGMAILIEGAEFGIHHIAGSGQASWFEFAQEIFDATGSDCRVMSATTEMVPRRARRPAYSVLGSERRRPVELPHWKAGLSDYLAERVRAGRGVMAP